MLYASYIYNIIYNIMAWTDSTIETGVMGVGEGSVCVSVQNMGGGGYDSQAKFDSL